MIKIEDISIEKMYVEQTEVSGAYLGDVLVYEQTGPTPPVAIDYVKFKANNLSSTLGLSHLSSHQTLEYSTDDGATWNTFDTNTSLNVSMNTWVLVRGILTGVNDTNDYTQFSTGANSNFTITGNVNTLWDYTAADLGSGFTLQEGCGTYTFKQLGGTIDVSELQLPADVLTYNTYKEMFANNSITSAPELPATTLGEGCYAGMFMVCPNLTESPILGASTLVNACYAWMFYSCSSLSKITCLASNPTEPWVCSNWTNGVASNGTFIKNPNVSNWGRGYDGIPYNWTVVDNIDYVKFKANSASTLGLQYLSTNQTLQYSSDNGTTWNTFDTSTTINMSTNDEVLMRGILSADVGVSDYSKFRTTGNLTVSGNINTLWDYTAVDLGAAFQLKKRCGSHLFQDCTAIYDVSGLTIPSTNLAEGCYEYMFYGCATISTAPVLPATTLVEDCYNCMFNGCALLSYIKCLATDISATNCTYYWVANLMSLVSGTFVKASTMTNWTTGTSGIPSGWTVQDAQ